MAHPRVEQLRFARSEFLRGLEGVTEETAQRRVGQMNSIGWMVGHMAWHEQLYWLTRGQGVTPFPKLNESVGSGLPASTPSLAEMRAAWHEVTAAVDPWLDGLDAAGLHVVPASNTPTPQSLGTMLLRVTYHYFVHCGEASAVRQMVEGGELPEFVGPIQELAPWRAEPGA